MSDAKWEVRSFVKYDNFWLRLTPVDGKLDLKVADRIKSIVENELSASLDSKLKVESVYGPTLIRLEWGDYINPMTVSSIIIERDDDAHGYRVEIYTSSTCVSHSPP